MEKLIGDKTIIVDDEYAELIDKYHWRAIKSKNTFYAYRWFNGRYQPLHRLILPNVELVDHINHNGLDNRRSNLRAATIKENNRNTLKRQSICGKPTTSKFKGVYWRKDKQKWISRIKLDGKFKMLGSYINELQAAEAYDKAARQYFGEFACPNFN